MATRFSAKLRSFLADESGAVTVDWVVLTASVVGLALAAVMIVRTAAVDPAQGIASLLNSVPSETFDK